MNGFLIFWICLIIFSIGAFLYMSVKMLYKGIPELRNMFRHLDETKENR